jgi:phosphocarrier protein
MSAGARQRSPVRRRLEIKNEKGLHARAASLLVETLRNYDAEITVTKDGRGVNGKSILELLMLAAVQGSVIDVAARGPDAEAAVAAIERLVEGRFCEDS